MTRIWDGTTRREAPTCLEDHRERVKGSIDLQVHSHGGRSYVKTIDAMRWLDRLLLHTSIKRDTSGGEQHWCIFKTHPS